MHRVLLQGFHLYGSKAVAASTYASKSIAPPNAPLHLLLTTHEFFLCSCGALSRMLQVDRCVDRAMRGNLPQCPKCSGATLKYGHDGFYCPGYYESVRTDEVVEKRKSG